MALVVSEHIAIPDEELEWKFIRSSGPGGQNVNKVASAVQLRFLLPHNTSLPVAAGPAAPARGTEADRRRQHPADRAVPSAARNRTGAPPSSASPPSSARRCRAQDPQENAPDPRLEGAAHRRQEATAPAPNASAAAASGTRPLLAQCHLQDVVPKLLRQHELRIRGDAEQRIRRT